MGTYKRKDRFYQKAKEEGHVSRAFYKLEQIQKKFKVFKRGDKVVDLGCAPGGWMELISKLVGDNGNVLGVDILPLKINLRPNMIFIQEDITSQDVMDKITDKMDRVDVVVSDMAPSTSGVKFRDSYLSYELSMRALVIARKVLKRGGNFITKIFPGEEFADFKKEMQKYFEKVSQYRPEATRKSSNEVYLIGMRFVVPGTCG